MKAIQNATENVPACGDLWTVARGLIGGFEDLNAGLINGEGQFARRKDISIIGTSDVFGSSVRDPKAFLCIHDERHSHQRGFSLPKSIGSASGSHVFRTSDLRSAERFSARGLEPPQGRRNGKRVTPHSFATHSDPEREGSHRS